MLYTYFVILKLLVINLKSIWGSKSNRILYGKHLRETFFRIQIFSDTKFPKTFPHSKVSDSVKISYRFHVRYCKHQNESDIKTSRISDESGIFCRSVNGV